MAAAAAEPTIFFLRADGVSNVPVVNAAAAPRIISTGQGIVSRPGAIIHNSTARPMPLVNRQASTGASSAGGVSVSSTAAAYTAMFAHPGGVPATASTAVSSVAASRQSSITGPAAVTSTPVVTVLTHRAPVATIAGVPATEPALAAAPSPLPVCQSTPAALAPDGKVVAAASDGTRVDKGPAVAAAAAAATAVAAAVAATAAAAASTETSPSHAPPPAASEPVVALNEEQNKLLENLKESAAASSSAHAIRTVVSQGSTVKPEAGAARAKPSTVGTFGSKKRPSMGTPASPARSDKVGGTGKVTKGPKRQLSDDSFDRRSYASNAGQVGASRDSRRSTGGAPSATTGSPRMSNGSNGVARRSSPRVGSLRSVGSVGTPGGSVTMEVGGGSVASSSSKADENSCKLGAEFSLREGQSMTPVQSLDADIRCMAAVAVGADLAVWCGERDGSIAVRDAVTAAINVRIPQAQIEHDFVWVVLQVDDTVWVGTSSGRMRIYNAASRQMQVQRKRHSGGIYALATLGRSVYSASNDFTIMEWDRLTCDATSRSFCEHNNQVRCLCVCSGRLVSGSDDRTIRVWEGKGRTESVHCFKHSDGVLALAYMPSSRKLSGNDEGNLWAGDNSGTITIYDWKERKKVQELKEHTGPVFSIMRKHGLVISASADTTLKVWDPASLTCLRSLTAHSSYVAAIAPVAREVRTRIWSASADKVLRTWSLRHRSIIDEGFERLQDESEHLALLNRQLEDDVKSAQAAAGEKEEQAAKIQLQMEKEDQRMREIERIHREQAEELREALRKQGDRLAQVTEDLSSSGAQNEQLQAELQATRQQLSDKQVQEEVATVQLSQTSQELEETRSQLAEQQDQTMRLEADLLASAATTQQLERHLEQVQGVAAAAETDRDKLQGLVDEEAPFKQGRLSFVSEVWSMHKRLTDARKHSASVAKAHAPQHEGGAKVRGAKVGPHISDAEQAHQHVKSARDHATMVIAKYLSDDEKRHLGIPLNLLEAKGVKPMDWDEVSSQLTDMSLVSAGAASSKAGSTTTGSFAVSAVSARSARTSGTKARSPSATRTSRTAALLSQTIPRVSARAASPPSVSPMAAQAPASAQNSATVYKPSNAAAVTASAPAVAAAELAVSSHREQPKHSAEATEFQTAVAAPDAASNELQSGFAAVEAASMEAELAIDMSPLVMSMDNTVMSGEELPESSMQVPIDPVEDATEAAPSPTSAVPASPESGGIPMRQGRFLQAGRGSAISPSGRRSSPPASKMSVGSKSSSRKAPMGEKSY